MGEYKSLIMSKRNKSQNIKFKHRQNQRMLCLGIHTWMVKPHRKYRHDLKFRSTLNSDRKERSMYNQRRHIKGFWGKVRGMFLCFGLWLPFISVL